MRTNMFAAHLVLVTTIRQITKPNCQNDNHRKYQFCENRTQGKEHLMNEILFASDVMRWLKISRPTLYRWHNESLAGVGTFPVAISEPGKKLRWRSTDIDAWLQRQVRAVPPKSTVKVTGARERRCKVKELDERQLRAAERLEWHCKEKRNVKQ